MKKKKLIFSIVVSLVLATLLAVLVYLATKPYEVEYDGMITVEVVNVDGSVVKSKEIGFKEGDKLRDLIASNFDNFVIEESEYGAYVTAIESISQNDNEFVYVALFFDNDYSILGLDSLEFKDGSTISFKAEKWQ